MTEKVILTKKQADVLELVISILGRDHAMDAHKNSEWVGSDWESLDDLSNSTMAKALYVGYEVKPKFELGQWVVDENGNIGVIRRYDEGGFLVEHADGSLSRLWERHLDRHATPREIWWAERGRKTNELKVKDVLVSKLGPRFLTVRSIDNYGNVNTGDGFGYQRVEEVLSRYAVVCIAENREDVSGDE